MTQATSLPRKKLPIGIQTFSHIRAENHYYVDKTAFALKLANEGKYYFLSRPGALANRCFSTLWRNCSPQMNHCFASCIATTVGIGRSNTRSSVSALPKDGCLPPPI